MATLPYLLWLTGREGLRPETAAALLRRFGTAEAVYFADEKEFELLQLPGRLCRSLADKSLAGAEHILADCDRLGIFLVTCQDAAYPERLRQLHDYPLVLYGKGKLPRFDEELAIAMVGSRDCTPYGVNMAGRLGLELARSGALVISGLVLDRRAHTCTLNDRPLSLTPTEFSILQILCEHKGEVVSSEELFHAIWKDEYYSRKNNTITVHIRHLREKMGDSYEDPKYIKTVWGIGFTLSEQG